MSAPRPPARSVETVTCADGWRLAVEVVAPAEPRAVAVVGHAMMVDRRTMDWRGDGLVSTLAEAGVAALSADLRGHGASGPGAGAGGRWSYDDLVELDAPALYRHARARFPGLPCAAVGHSLFGHVALARAARHGRRTGDGDGPGAIVALAANIWGRRCEPRPLQLAGKRALLEAVGLVVRAVGHLPARRVGFGSSDEPADYWEDVVRSARRGFHARDGFSYEAALPSVPERVLAIAGAGDRCMCPPRSAALLVAGMPRATVEVVGRASGLPLDPGHMALVTDEACRPLWRRIARFLLAPDDSLSR